MNTTTNRNCRPGGSEWLAGQLVILAVLVGVTTFISGLCWHYLPNTSQGFDEALLIVITIVPLIGCSVWATGLCMYDIYVGRLRGGTGEKAQKWDC